MARFDSLRRKLHGRHTAFLAAPRKKCGAALPIASRQAALALSLVLGLLPPGSRAAAVGHIDDGALLEALVFVLVVWFLLTLALFLVLRRWKRSWSVVASVLFFLSPLLALGLRRGYDALFDEYTVQVEEKTKAPLTVVGATFPPGSTVKWNVTGSRVGRLLWPAKSRKVLRAIHSASSVLSGNVRITGVRIDGYVEIDVAGDQVIDGWECAAGPFDPQPEFDITPNGLKLRACTLSAPRRLNGRIVPAGAQVSRSGDSDAWNSYVPHANAPHPPGSS